MKKGLPPLIDNKTEIIVLGTLPGKKSISEYYSDPRNQFWDLIGNIFNSEISSDSNYEEKCNLLLKNKIGLWDIFSKADRDGSSDKKIKNAVPNDFEELFRKYPNIKFLIFNGVTIEKHLKRAKIIFFQDKQYDFLHSTSSQNGWKTLSEKEIEWKSVLKKYIN